MLDDIRAFFRLRDVLEVSTPLVSSAGNTDPHIDSLRVSSAFSDTPYYLHTSPELPMKRLLAAGVGDCFQLCPVFRDGEAGRNHNPEFTMLEWYRLGFAMLELVAEVEALIDAVAGEVLPKARLSYVEAFQRTLGLCPLSAEDHVLQGVLDDRGLWQREQGELPRDAMLDLLFSQLIAPEFPANRLTTVYHYPASQASLARLLPGDQRLAERFELYWGAVELANGFHELAEAKEQRQRFQRDNQQRLSQGLPALPLDENFLQAMAAGLPDCSGVAVGVDRLLMQCLGASHIHEVLAFDWGRI